LSLLKLKVDHSYFFFLGANRLFSILESVFLDVALFIVNAQLIISVNELNTHIVSALTGHFILIYEVIHLFLKRVNNQIQLISFVNLLNDNVLFSLVNSYTLV
jgi:hypothetical protein